MKAVLNAKAFFCIIRNWMPARRQENVCVYVGGGGRLISPYSKNKMQNS